MGIGGYQGYEHRYVASGASLVAQTVKNPPVMWETWDVFKLVARAKTSRNKGDLKEDHQRWI